MSATALFMLVLTLLALCVLAYVVFWFVVSAGSWAIIKLTEMFCGIRIILSFGEEEKK